MSIASAARPATDAQVRRSVIIASAGAAAIHFGAAYAHLQEYRPAGYFMVLAGLAQLTWALMVAHRLTRRVMVLGVAGNAAIVVLWLVSRTLGLPLGEMPWTAEYVHAPDALCSVLELFIVLGATALLRPSFPRPARLLTWATGAGTLLSTVAVAHDPGRERAAAVATLLLLAGAVLVFSKALRPHAVAVPRAWRTRIRALVAAMLGLALLLMPPSARAATRTPHADITITWAGELNRAHGVRSGRGTPSDPYVISGWTVNNLSIKDTEKAIRIVDNTITGTLTLNWIGRDIEVRGNDVSDLRVNENNARWGDPTAGMIVRNTFARVGQLRHFDGMFAYNTVGSPQSGMLSSKYPDTRAVNFDGFNGAHFMRNTIYGYVEARLHGHHHSSTYGTSSHVHADGPHDMNAVDHTRRYHEVFIHENRIYTSNTYALEYVDTDHAGNDRTANSETNPYLNAPHTHYTRVHILSNVLYGAGILVDVFNAQDERHVRTPSGLVDIAGNRVTLERDLVRPFEALQGIEVRQARYLTLRIRSNTVAGPVPLIGVEPLRALQSHGAGILLNRLDHANVYILSDRVSNRQFGVHALRLAKTVRWTIRGLVTTDVDRPVAYDGTVANPPRRS